MNPLIANILVIFLFMCTMFLIALVKKNNSIVDIGWGLGFVVVALFSFFTRPLHVGGSDTSQMIITLLVVLWGLRLSLHLLVRNWGQPEDWRYAKWRMEWGKYVVVRSFFQVFMLQGVFMFIILLPVLLANSSFDSRKSLLGIPVFMLYLVGLLVWVIGFFFQSISDYQLLKFKRNHLNKGKVMRYGLWKYSRHPNYFGEATMWWGVFVLSLISCFSIGDAVLRLLGPVTITFLLLKVSGVVMLEKKYSGNPEYEDYQKKTSSFLPCPPRKEDEL